MAKVNITLDTEELTMSCTVDGEKLEHLRDINIYHYPETSYSKEKYEFSARTHEMKNGDVQKCMYLYASHQKSEKQILSSDEDVKKAIAKKIRDYLNK
jgi:hypothetical protein